MNTTRLTSAEVAFFKENGYLIMRDLLDPALMAQAREALWAGAPAELQRDAPQTWVGPFKEESSDPDSVRHGYTWKYRAPGREEWMVRLLPKNPSVWAIAEQLLGVGALEEPDRVRGIYCMMPEGETPATPYHCHVDQHPFHLGVVAYIGQVVPDGGGFTVWPGSHQRFYHAFSTRYSFNPTERYAIEKAQVDQQPKTDCYGAAGDVVFWHHRIGHSAGHNRSRQIRQAVLYDFKKKELEATKDAPPGSDLWIDWAIGS